MVALSGLLFFIVFCYNVIGDYMISLIFTIISIIGIIGYLVNLPILTYIAAGIIVGVDIFLLFLPFYRKPSLVAFIIGPSVGYLINHSILGVALGICIADVAYELIWLLISKVFNLLLSGAKKNHVGDKYTCSKCGFELKASDRSCPNCSASFK